MTAGTAPAATSSRTPARGLAAAGIAANALFWSAVIGFAALRPDYSHLTKAVSELGAIGAPRMWAFNLAGYVVPGLLIAGVGWTIGRRHGSTAIAVLLALAGLGLVIAGAFPGDLRDFHRPTTQLHVAGALMGLLWAPAMPWLAVKTRRTWPALAAVSAAAFALFLLAFGLYAVIPEAPCLVQRATFGVWLAWYVAVAVLSLRGV